MKTRLTQLKLLGVLCCSFATTAGFSQTTVIWGGAGTEIGAATNWVGGVIPNTANNDTAEWNGVQSGALNLVYDTSVYQSGPGSSGINLYFTANQTSPVTFNTDLGVTAFLAIGNIALDSGAGIFTLGGTDPAHRVKVIGRPSGAVHSWVNNSATPALINQQVEWQGGGGANWTMDFSGTGDWDCENYLNQNNGPSTVIQVDGPGNMIWNPVGFLGANGIASPITINAGTMILKGSHPRLSNQAWTINGTFVFDATNSPTSAQTLSGAISGAAPGVIMVTNGSLTLSSGNSTYSGNFVLAGTGEVFVNGAENVGVSGPLGFGGPGIGGTITFNGGALGYAINNVYDYSFRFDTNSGQNYKIDSNGQNVIFTNSAGLTGGNSLTKIGPGSLTLAGPSTYTGLTTVSAGKLLIQGTKSGSASITVADGAILGVTATGSSITPGTLTLGAGASATFEFNNVNSTVTPIVAAGTISTGGPITVNINSGTFTPGQSYPLFSWSNGTAPGVNLGILNGYIGNLSTNGSSIQLNIVATAYKWTGNNNNSWDKITANNWQQNGSPVLYADGGPVLFDDTASGNTAITLSDVVLPTSVTFNNVNSNYSIASSGTNNIGGGANLNLNAAGTVMLSGGTNTYTGVTTLNSGVLSVSALAIGGSASDIGAATTNAANLVLNGGKLQYTGGATSSDRFFTLGTASGSGIDASGTGALTLTAPALAYSGNGARNLSLIGTSGDTNTLAAMIADNGGGTTVTKNGTGTWILTANSTYSGVTTVNAGALQFGNGGATGSPGNGNILDNAGLDFNRNNTITVNGVISGTGSVTNDGAGTLILANNNSYSGGTVINAGTLQVGNGGSSGSLNISSPVLNNGTLEVNVSGTFTMRGYGASVSGSGNVWVHKGTFQSLGGNSYTGWTLIDSGATFQPTIGNESTFNSLAPCTNNGTLLFVRQDGNPAVFGMSNNITGTGKVVKENNNFNAGWIVLAGTNSYTGGTFIAGGSIVLGDGITPGGGQIVGPVTFTNTTSGQFNPRSLIFNHPEDYTFTNRIFSVVTDSSTANSGALEQMGPGALTLTGSVSYPGSTTIDNGSTLQFGNGGTGGAIGTGAINAGGTLVIDHSDNVTISAAINDNTYQGSLVQLGTGTLTLTVSNGYSGPTTVSNGTLVVSGGYVGGDLDVEGGTIAPAAAGTVSILHIGGNVNMDSGTVLATLNKSVALTDPNLSVTVSNTFYAVSNLLNFTAGTINATGGTLKLINAGPVLAVGDKFTLFSEPVTGGALMTIVSPGFTVNNNLATDGSVTVATVLPAPAITASVSGTSLNLSWPAAYTGYVVQVQTNTLAKGLGTNWVTIPGTDAGNTYSASLNKTNGAAFYRLAP
jgi:fibronectin-binding autotransporter adhesin